jgi:hypothetical protein
MRQIQVEIQMLPYKFWAKVQRKHFGVWFGITIHQKLEFCIGDYIVRTNEA